MSMNPKYNWHQCIINQWHIGRLYKLIYKTITYICMSFLNNTKKTAQLDTKLDPKKSGKLPKLTIQQQIDNNQVIERMNRKITFTKNQRHLAKTIQFAEALQTTNVNNASLFRIDPEEVYFTNFEANKVYESQIKLVNRSKHIQRIKITPLQKKQFVVSNVKYPIEDSGDIAPGMQVSIFVRFKPTNLHDNEDELLVIVGDGVARVPIKAQREKCKGQWPVQINCGHCWVGDQQSKQISIPNTGGGALYRLENAQQNQKIIGPFKIWPTQLRVEKSKKNIIYVNFSPKAQGIFQEKVTYVSNQGEQQRVTIKLKGGAYSAQITLDQINNQRVAVKKFHNCLYLNNCQPGKLSQSHFKIHNHAVVPVDYLWHYQAEPNFSISEAKGKISASEIVQFTARYQPTSRHPKNIVAHLYLYNLPKQSILRNSSRIIDGIQMIECLKLQVKVSSQASSVEVTPLHKTITDKLYKDKPKRTSFSIHNNSQVDRKYWITKIKQDKFCLTDCNLQEEKTIKAGQTEQLWFTFMITQLTKEEQRAYFLVNFDNLPSKLISIEGRVQYPDLELYSTNVEFQLLRTNSVYRKLFKMVNPGENEILFKFNNSYRFYQLDFYDFYQFQTEQFYESKLKIMAVQGECKEWMIVQPNQQKIIQFELNTKHAQNIDLFVELEVKDGNKYKVRVTAEVEQAQAKISQTYIPLKQIFQGNLYNSNKFLPRQLSIDNPGNLPIRYQIIPTEIEECLINISELSGKVGPKKKKRIDVVLQPLKTGPFSPIFKINYFDDITIHPQSYNDNNDIIQIPLYNRKNLIKQQTLTIEGKIRGVETAYYIKDESRAKKVSQKLVDDAHTSVKMSIHSHKSAPKSHYLQSYKIVYPPLEELNFYNCEINKVQQLEIIVENNSQLTAQFQVYAQNYRSIEKAASQTKIQAKGMMQNQELAFTSNMGKTYIESRALNQAQKIYLSNNKGISIMCEPSAGVLHKKQSQKIVVTMFNDTSGRFKDSLIVHIKDHETKKFPINMQIKGTPVSLSRNQLGINFNREIPLLSAGTFLTNNGKSTRNIKILNNGPRQVELKWVIYPYGSSNSESDLFNISFNPAEPGTNNIVEVFWQAIKPKPLQKSTFSITPASKLLKGREEVNFLLTIQQTNEAQQLQALIVGEPIMIEQTGKVQMEQLAMIAQAEMTKPTLKIDQQHQNQINKFEKFAVIGNQFRTKANDFHQKIKLKNNFRCNMSFSVSVVTLNSKVDYFQLSSTSSDSPLSKLKPKTLTPTLSKTKNAFVADVERQFTLPYQSYVEVGIDLKANPKNIDEWPLQMKIRKQGSLIINFSNGDKQVVPLVGWLYRPSLQIQMPNTQLHSHENALIDFGVVHVNNHRKKSIYLANPTLSAADWTISYVKYQQTKKIIFQKELWTDLDFEDENITDEKKCFRLSHDSGHILAQSIPIHYIPGTLALQNQDDNYAETHKPFKLDFLFKPENNVLYKSKFIIKVEHGPSYEIILRGRGTFEQQAEIK